MIVWGGCPEDPGEDCFGGHGVYTGGHYNPTTNTWAPTTVVGTPGVRHNPRAVWTGSGMIVWGGIQTDSGTYTYTGGRYSVPSLP